MITDTPAQTIETWTISNEDRNKLYQIAEESNVSEIEDHLKKYQVADIQFGTVEKSNTPIEDYKPTEHLKLIWENGPIKVFCPEHSFTEDHLVITSEEDNPIEVQRVINKIISALGTHPVISKKWDSRYIEILPANREWRDTFDRVNKLHSYFYTFFGRCYPTAECNAQYWAEKLSTDTFPPFSQSTEHEPLKKWTQVQSRISEGHRALLDRLESILYKAGIRVERKQNDLPSMPDIHLEKKPSCFCCNETLRNNQFIFETDLSYVLCSHKPISDHHVLIFPKRHVQHINDLREDEIQDLDKLSTAICRVFEKLSGSSQIMISLQDGPEVGQTVQHAHYRIIAVPSELKVAIHPLIYDHLKSSEPAQMKEIGEKLAPEIKAIYSSL